MEDLLGSEVIQEGMTLRAKEVSPAAFRGSDRIDRPGNVMKMVLKLDIFQILRRVLRYQRPQFMTFHARGSQL